MYAAIRQGKAKAGKAEELARTIKEGAIPIISDVPGFMAYYVVYAPDDTVTAISIFNDYAEAEELNRRALAWIEQNQNPRDDIDRFTYFSRLPRKATIRINTLRANFRPRCIGALYDLPTAGVGFRAPV